MKRPRATENGRHRTPRVSRRNRPIPPLETETYPSASAETPPDHRHPPNFDGAHERKDRRGRPVAQGSKERITADRGVGGASEGSVSTGEARDLLRQRTHDTPAS